MNTVAIEKMEGSIQPGESVATGQISIKNYMLILFQLGLILLVFRQFQIESSAFRLIAMLAFGGFAIHALLPLQYRLHFFLVLSLASIVTVLDPVNGMSVILIGLLLIGICHLPISFGARAGILLAVTVGLAALRAEWVSSPISNVIWPILGSMFMFRLIIYFYELRHDKAPATPIQTLSYFFMLPNVCFPLFPVIDYKTYRNNYFDDDAYRIYQVGIDWIVRGVIHLLLYRYVYYHLTLSPAEVAGPAELSQYLVANFLLYLRVSGLFHLIIGMLYIFGFRLPETHNRWLLMSSFTDFWRRINIYWKDFMQKVFFYPMLFRLRGLGTTNAMIVATLLVFLLTWFLHAYQWFWLRGTLLFVVQDILFWTILGGLVVLNALYELKYGRKRSLGKQAHTWRSIIVLSAKSYVTFWCICILWSFWTIESLDDWFSLWSVLGGEYTTQFLLFPLVSLAVIVLGHIESKGIRNTRASEQNKTEWMRARVVTLIALMGLIVISVESVQKQFGAEVANSLHSLKSGRLSRLDTAKLEQGYYENLLSVDRFNSQLWEVYSKKPTNWLDNEFANLKNFVGGFVQTENIPAFVFESNHGTITMNKWGMRDRDYDLAPSPGTFRMAMLGASSVMGWGVGDGETFEAILENRLNHEDTTFSNFEILNMGVAGYQPLQQVVALEKALRFKPDAVVYIATGREPSRSMWYLVEAVQKGIEIPYEPLREIIQRSGVHRDMDDTTARRALQSYREEILIWTYRRIVEQSQTNGAVPVFVFLPQVREGTWQEETLDTMRIASEAGFIMIDLNDVFEGVDIANIRLAEWDDHPNQQGHQLIADRLYSELQQQRSTVFVQP